MRVNQGGGRQEGRGEAARSEQPPHRGQLLLMIHNFMWRVFITFECATHTTHTHSLTHPLSHTLA